MSTTYDEWKTTEPAPPPDDCSEERGGHDVRTTCFKCGNEYGSEQDQGPTVVYGNMFMPPERAHLVTLRIREPTLQELLDLLTKPDECFPTQHEAQNFFEMHWDLVEELAEIAKRIGLKPSHEGDEEEGELEDDDGTVF